MFRTANHKLFLVLLALALTAAACSPAPAATAPPADTQAPANTEAPAAPTEASAPAFEGTAVSYGALQAVLPSGLASGVSGMQVARLEASDDNPYWGITPGHIQVNLDGYALQDKFHQPAIYVYPAQDYAAMHPPAADNIARLQSAMQGGSEMPNILFFNAGQVFASNVQVIDFQNGSGVRFLTEYAQYVAPVNNYDLFYNFQGLTSDGQYYIVAILPVTSTLLAEDADPASPVPAGGVALPDYNDANADWNGYYAAATSLLNAAPAESFTPTLAQLDALIASMQITE